MSYLIKISEFFVSCTWRTRENATMVGIEIKASLQNIHNTLWKEMAMLD